MRRICLLFALFLGSMTLSSALLVWGADDDVLKTTTEFGITITGDDLTDAIEETQQFWEPIRLYVGSDKFAGADAETRKAALEFLNSVQQGFYDQLFNGDESSAQDLVEFLGLRLRKFIIYRRLREAVSDDAALAQLVERWERAHRDINALKEDQRAERIRGLLGLMDEEMKAVGLDDAHRAKAKPLWDLQCQCIEKMNGTKTGVMMIGFEHKARHADRALGEVLRQVTTAADWAMIVKPEDRLIGLDEFKSAWDQLADLHAKRLATRPAELK